MTDTRTSPKDLREQVAIAMRDVSTARMPKHSGADLYPLEEFFPEAERAIAVTLKAAELAIVAVFPGKTEITSGEILSAIYSLLPPVNEDLY